VLSDGSPWRPLVHVRDVADAFLAALEAPSAAVHDRAFNVGSDEENRRVRDLASLAGDVCGATVSILGAPDPDARSYRVSFARIRAALPRFRTEWSARAGAEELRDAYVRYGLTHEAFERRLVRLAHIADLQASGEVLDDLRPAKPVREAVG
jgi:nucleoside-diphosphate-sugar epimerase